MREVSTGRVVTPPGKAKHVQSDARPSYRLALAEKWNADESQELLSMETFPHVSESTELEKCQQVCGAGARHVRPLGRDYRSIPPVKDPRKPAKAAGSGVEYSTKGPRTSRWFFFPELLLSFYINKGLVGEEISMAIKSMPKESHAFLGQTKPTAISDWVLENRLLMLLKEREDLLAC
ncbi:hypothetical protein L6452_43525 [Arctium lappa]|uniref:Uncharacterized protein n=1 Tax=Arctium lappa TaxID=4217 RepID=A0ACB8XDW7_ARCLA|nr:hypothetical protein L6452_43525 [Arctium lappa]